MIVNKNIQYKTIKLHAIIAFDDYDDFINRVNKFCENINAINVQVIQEKFNNGITFIAIISERIYSDETLHVHEQY